MITRMKKLQCLVYHREYDEFLEQLRSLGVVHVVTRTVSETDANAINETVKRREQISAVIKGLGELLQKGETPAAAKGDNVDDLLAQYNTLTATQNDCLAQVKKLEADIEELTPWGEFSPALLEKIHEAGYTMHFYECPKKSFNPEWEGVFVVNEVKGRVLFVNVAPNATCVHGRTACEGEYCHSIYEEANQAPIASFPEATELTLPNESLSALQQQLVACGQKKGQVADQLHALAISATADLQQAIADLQQNIDFARVSCGTERAAEGNLALLEGWIPANKADEAERVIGQKAYCEMSDPTPDDNIPILLQNDAFTRMFEPIMKLYMMPKYSELDLTPFFAPFYMLFFGLCLGDTGYGLFILLAAIAARFVIKSADMRGYINLVITLGISATLCGLLSGSFFGFNMYEDGWPLMDKAEQYLHVENSNMFNLALGLGVVQILFGMVLKVVNRWIQFGWKFAVGTISWILVLVSVGLTMALPELPQTPLYAVMGVGLAGAALYNSPDQSILLNPFIFLWDAYNMATGLLGDILSYVRLFALGLSGGILATVFNSLATGFSPDNAVLGPVVWIIIFLIGHGLNIFMSALGAMVHPLRLTFVEFFKNAGFEGGSMEYAPFKK